MPRHIYIYFNFSSHFFKKLKAPNLAFTCFIFTCLTGHCEKPLPPPPTPQQAPCVRLYNRGGTPVGVDRQYYGRKREYFSQSAGKDKNVNNFYATRYNFLKIFYHFLEKRKTPNLAFTCFIFTCFTGNCEKPLPPPPTPRQAPRVPICNKNDFPVQEEPHSFVMKSEGVTQPAKGEQGKKRFSHCVKYIVLIFSFTRLSYKWYKNGRAHPGMIQAILCISHSINVCRKMIRFMGTRHNSTRVAKELQTPRSNRKTTH